MKTYDLEDTGSDYMPHREMVECEGGDWVRVEDVKALVKQGCEEGFIKGADRSYVDRFLNLEAARNKAWNDSAIKKEIER